MSTGTGTVNQLADLLEQVQEAQDTTRDQLAAITKTIADMKKPINPIGLPNGGARSSFHIRKGEDPLSSRPFSLCEVVKRLRLQATNDGGYVGVAKAEAELSRKLLTEYYQGASWPSFSGGFVIPLGSDLMPTTERTMEDGTQLRAVSKSLREECRDFMRLTDSPDVGELVSIFKSMGYERIAKDLSANTATSGGTLVGMASQGELIDVLRAMEVFSRAGAVEIDLPPQGSIRFPRVTGSVTITPTSEGATISESTPTTGALSLSAKPYTGLTDVPDELLRFSTSVSVEAWLRREFLREIALKGDRDMINGVGGTSILGIVNYAGIESLTASTVGNDGNLLEPQDPTLLFAAIADNDAPVDMGFFLALTNTLWGSVTTRRADAGAGAFVFASAFNSVGSGPVRMTLNGHNVITSTQIPTNRAKGVATNLTLLLAGVPTEWIIARAGIVDVAVTNSDASKFQQRITTVRGTQYLDAGARHPASFGIIDTLLNA